MDYYFEIIGFMIRLANHWDKKIINSIKQIGKFYPYLIHYFILNG